MNIPSTLPAVSLQERNILLSLLYFDIFLYPLTEEEIIRFAPEPLYTDIKPALADLTERGLVFRFDHYYSLTNDRRMIDRRRAGNELAEKKIITAKRVSRFIAAVPFVRAVMLSGSISKGYMDRQSDIDYFIVTEAGKLWLVRTALALFRRLFLLNSHKNFCTNYFITQKTLEIGEKNIFTAIESTTLRPMYGKTLVHEFQAANSWCDIFLPNRQVQNGLGDERDFFLKKTGERILSHSLFDRLDRWLMERSIKYWKRRYGKMLEERDFQIAFQSTPDISRSHPEFFQKRVLTSYFDKIKSFEVERGIKLTK